MSSQDEESESEDFTDEESLSSNESVNSKPPPLVNMWLQRKRLNYKETKKVPELTREILEWPYLSSEDEQEKKLTIQAELNKKSTKASEALKEWKRKKELYRKYRPHKVPQKFPVFKETISVKEHDSPYGDILQVVVEKQRPNQEIFKKSPMYFNVNPFFIDLDAKFNTNWFTIREPIYELKRLGEVVEASEFAKNLIGMTKKRVTIKDFQKKSSAVDFDLATESESEEDEDDDDDEKTKENDKPKPEEKTKQEDEEVKDLDENFKKFKDDKKSVTKVSVDQDPAIPPVPAVIAGSKNEGNPDSDIDFDAASRLDDKTKMNILRNAALYRQEYGLKRIKAYFYMWKRKIDKLNELNLKHLREKEEKRGKKMTEKSLIQRDTVVKAVARDKAPSKELYYQTNAKEIKLEHKLPKNLNKFIRNCNNIYKIVKKKYDENGEEIPDEDSD